MPNENNECLVLDKRGIITAYGKVLEQDGDFFLVEAKDKQFRMHKSRVITGKENMVSYLKREIKRWSDKLAPAKFYKQHLNDTLLFAEQFLWDFVDESLDEAQQKGFEVLDEVTVTQ